MSDISLGGPEDRRAFIVLLKIMFAGGAASPAPIIARTSYVYGHACHHPVCSFTRLKDASVGDWVTVTTAAATLTYRIKTPWPRPNSHTHIS